MSLSRNSLASLLSSSTPLIVHHWDADGVFAAVTAAQFTGPGASFLVPPFTYEPDQKFMNRLLALAADKDIVLVLDYSAPQHVLAAMVSAVGNKPVVVVDHHMTSYPRISRLLYYNPAMNGDPEGLWPSAAHVVAEALGFYDPMLVAASIYGDLLEEAPNNRVFRAYMKELGMDPEADLSMIRDCAMQVWGAEANMELDVLEGLAYSLTYGAVDPCEALMSDPRLTNMRLMAEDEVRRLIDRALSEAEVRGGVMVARARTRLRIGGMVARELRRKAKEDIVVLSLLEDAVGLGRIYVRGSRFSPRALAEGLRSKWRSVGAKEEPGNMVVSLQVPGDKLDEALNDVLSLLGA